MTPRMGVVAKTTAGGASSSSAGSAPVDAGVPMDPDAGSIVVGPRPTCGGSGADTDNSCASLQALEFENPEFTWEFGGLGQVVVTITNTGSGIVPYPCFGLTVDQPTTNLPTTLEPDVYVLKAGQSGPYTSGSVRGASAAWHCSPLHGLGGLPQCRLRRRRRVFLHRDRDLTAARAARSLAKRARDSPAVSWQTLSPWGTALESACF